MTPKDVRDMVALWPPDAQPVPITDKLPAAAAVFFAESSGMIWLENHPPGTKVTYHEVGGRVLCQRVNGRRMRQSWGGTRLSATHDAIMYVARRMGLEGTR